jgi:hypothetical protein
MNLRREVSENGRGTSASVVSLYRGCFDLILRHDWGWLNTFGLTIQRPDGLSLGCVIPCVCFDLVRGCFDLKNIGSQVVSEYWKCGSCVVKGVVESVLPYVVG